MMTLAQGPTCVMQAALVVAFVWVADVGGRAAAVTGNPPTVIETLRFSDRYLKAIVEQGLSRSGTLRNLVTHLERASVIVYVSYDIGLPLGTLGRTRFMAAAGQWRYLRIELSNRLPRVDLLTLLGHELQHAVEIADAPEIVDNASLAAFYRRIQAEVVVLNGPGQEAFETNAAIVAGQRVFRELFGAY